MKMSPSRLGAWTCRIASIFGFILAALGFLAGNLYRPTILLLLSSVLLSHCILLNVLVGIEEE